MSRDLEQHMSKIVISQAEMIDKFKNQVNQTIKIFHMGPTLWWTLYILSHMLRI